MSENEASRLGSGLCCGGGPDGDTAPPPARPGGRCISTAGGSGVTVRTGSSPGPLALRQLCPWPLRTRGAALTGPPSRRVPRHPHTAQPLTPQKQPSTPVPLCPQWWGLHRWQKGPLPPRGDRTPSFESPQAGQLVPLGKIPAGRQPRSSSGFRVISTFREACDEIRGQLECPGAAPSERPE